MARFKRLLITGAAGQLGTLLRETLAPLAEVLRLSDRADLGAAADHEELVRCELADRDALLALTRDVDAVVHFGGVSLEGRFDDILHSNIEGSYYLYEGCRRHGVGRVIYASSNHAVGFHSRTTIIDAHADYRPDSMYGVSKVFVESLGRYYYDKYRIETVNLRIGSCFPEPIDRRMLATWLSYRDLTQLVTRSLLAPRVGFSVVYGSSANREQFWDNRYAAHIGFMPEDSAEQYRDKVEAATSTADPEDPAVAFVGGGFAAAGHFEDD